MDEYYCPNCGATLNTQSGFDSNSGTWTCTECGQHLMDDDTFKGDIYEGVAWYCDECGSLLNKQSGFSDSYGAWTCTECGHTNGTTDDDIIEDCLSCPKCGASLNYQCGFNKYNDYRECSSCGTKLYHNYSDDEYSIVEDEEEEKIECPSCGANLKEQFCFADYEDDWECTECGAHLHHDYSSDPYIVSNDDMDDEDLDYDAETEAFVEYEKSFNYARQECELQKQKQHDHQAELDKKRCAKQRRRKFCKKHRKGINRFICIVLVGILILIGYYQYSKLIPTGYDDEELIGLSYEVVEEKLHNAGFTNLSTIATEDLALEQTELENIVFEVKINGDTDFQEDKKYPYNTEIIVRYHAITPVSAPVSYRESKKQNFLDVQKQFKDAGFVNVSVEPIYDVVLGWFVSDGEIESITINSEDDFCKGEDFRPDAEVVIKYHTLKKNRPKK